MAADLIDQKVRVNAICPGTTDTPSLAQRINLAPDQKAMRENMIARQPMKRFGKPEEIAEAVLFLCTNEFCTGIHLDVDGGMTL